MRKLKTLAANQLCGPIGRRLQRPGNLAVLKAQSDDALAFLKQQDYLLKSGVIAQRDYDIANTAYKSAVARYDQAAAQVNQAVVSQQSAAGSGMASSQAQLQQSQAQVQSSQAQVQQAQAQVQQAQAALSLAEINLRNKYSMPIDGRLYRAMWTWARQCSIFRRRRVRLLTYGDAGPSNIDQLTLACGKQPRACSSLSRHFSRSFSGRLKR